jgi:hypothetical protein
MWAIKPPILPSSTEMGERYRCRPSGASGRWSSPSYVTSGDRSAAHTSRSCVTTEIVSSEREPLWPSLGSAPPSSRPRSARSGASRSHAFPAPIGPRTEPTGSVAVPTIRWLDRGSGFRGFATSSARGIREGSGREMSHSSPEPSSSTEPGSSASRTKEADRTTTRRTTRSSRRSSWSPATAAEVRRRGSPRRNARRSAFRSQRGPAAPDRGAT